MQQEDNLQQEQSPQEFNNKPLYIEFGGLRELYSFYGTNSFPNSLKIKERRPTIDGKRVRRYFLKSQILELIR